VEITRVVDTLNAVNPRADANAESTYTAAIKTIFTFSAAVNVGTTTRTFKLTQNGIPLASGWPGPTYPPIDPTAPPTYPPIDPTAPPTYPPFDPTAPPTYPPFDPTNPPDPPEPTYPSEPAPDPPTYPDDPAA
jgi:hypothetical protein